MFTEYIPLDNGKLLEVCNHVKERLFIQLEKDGIVTDSQKLCESYAVIAVRKGWLGIFFDKLRGLKDDDRIQFEIVRIIK